MKRKLLFAMLCIVSALQVSAWDGSEGKVYLQNVGSGLWWGAGNDWGTQASLVQHPEYVTLHLEDGKYKLESQVSNGGTAYYFNGDYMDNGSPVSLTIAESDGVYTIANGESYYGYDGTSTVLGKGVDATTDNGKWKIFTEAEMLATFAGASAASPVDATFLILDPNFGRNNRNASAWTIDASNKNLAGGDNKNMCAESYHSTFTLTQTVSTHPAGVYKLTAQGFYRQDGSDNLNLPYFYLNDAKGTFPIKTGSENSMTDASGSFSAGDYTIAPIFVEVAEDEGINVGAKLEVNTALWCIWDNFVLTYIGKFESAEPEIKDQLDKIALAAQSDVDALILPTAAKVAATNTITNLKNGTYATFIAYDDAITAINKTVADAKEIALAYSHYYKKKVTALALDDNTEAFTGSASVDISAAESVMDNATTVEDVNSAQENAESLIRDAVATFLDAVTLNSGYRFDITNIYLENPDFEEPADNYTMPKGWNVNITGQNLGQQNASYEYESITLNRFIEAWIQTPGTLGDGVIAQTASTLPEGTYVLEADARVCYQDGYPEITGAGLFIKTSLKNAFEPISSGQVTVGEQKLTEIGHYAVSFSHSGEGEVQFGLSANSTNANWLAADNFKVYYAGPMDLSVYDDLLAEAVAEFEAYDGQVDATVYANLKTQVDGLNTTYGKSKEYATAIANVRTITEYAAAYALAEAAKADATNANVTGTEQTNINAALADAPTYADYTTYAEKTTALTEATATFNAAAPSYDKYVAYKTETVALFGTDFDVEAPTNAEEALAAVHNLNIAQYNKVADEYTYSLNGVIGDFGSWTGTATVAGEEATPNYRTNEHWSGKTHAYYEQAANGWGNANGWTIKYEKICRLPAGNYVLKVAARSSAGTTSKVSCSATATTIALPAEGASARGITVDGAASWDDSETFTKSSNGTENGGFGWQWRFLPFTLTEKTEVTMTFEAEASTQYQWMSIADGELLSDADVATPIFYDEVENNVVADEDIANVTVNRYIFPGYNTVVLPFNLGANQVTEAFGVDSEVYTFSESSADAEKAVVNFKKGDGSITANVPVLVKATDYTSTLEFKGVVIKAPTEELKIEGKNVDFVGSYVPVEKIAAGDYFLNADKLYRSEGNTTLNAFRAYLKVKDASVRAELFIDGVATAIEAIDADNSVQSGAVYNLAGQRVQKAQRGLYIVNGKKVVVK